MSPCVPVIFTPVWLCSVRRQSQGLERKTSCGDTGEVGSQQTLRQPELTLPLRLAGVTISACLSWASSPASGGPSPSSAGSVTESSVSCYPLCTSRTCTACGELLPWGGGVDTGCPRLLLLGWVHGCTVHGRAQGRGAEPSILLSPVRHFRKKQSQVKCEKDSRELV